MWIAEKYFLFDRHKRTIRGSFWTGMLTVFVWQLGFAKGSLKISLTYTIILQRCLEMFFIWDYIKKNPNHCIITLKLLEKPLIALCYLLIACLWLLTNEPSGKSIGLALPSAMQHVWHIPDHLQYTIYITGNWYCRSWSQSTKDVRTMVTLQQIFCSHESNL